VQHVTQYLEGREILEVEREILSGDPMYAYPGAEELYFHAGPSALRSIRLAMLAARLEYVSRVLDFACGAGRVLRTLKAAFPQAALTACDTWEEGVEFCSKVFGARGVVSDQNPSKVKLDGPFDLIWCGSLLTHLDRAPWLGFLQMFESLLAPGGVLVFTTRGRYNAEGLRSREIPLYLHEEQIRQVLRDYDQTGFGYYPAFTPDHGECITSRPWVCAQLDQAPTLQLLLYLERGWMSAQDVVACTK
jgi:SAM-dependent methyltransferase